MRRAGGSRLRLGCRPALAGRVRSAFRLMRGAVAESPELPLCADDHDQRRDRPGRSDEKPGWRRNAETRSLWRIAPELAPDTGTGFAPRSTPKPAAMPGKRRRGWTTRLPQALHLSGTQSLARPAP